MSYFSSTYQLATQKRLQGREPCRARKSRNGGAVELSFGAHGLDTLSPGFFGIVLPNYRDQWSFWVQGIVFVWYEATLRDPGDMRRQ